MFSQLTLGCATLVVCSIGFAAQAQSVPCEESLKDLRAAVASTTLAPDSAQKVSDLEAKGIERCNADDDKRADAFFDQAMTIVTGK